MSYKPDFGIERGHGWGEPRFKITFFIAIIFCIILFIIVVNSTIKESKRIYEFPPDWEGVPALAPAVNKKRTGGDASPDEARNWGFLPSVFATGSFHPAPRASGGGSISVSPTLTLLASGSDNKPSLPQPSLELHIIECSKCKFKWTTTERFTYQSRSQKRIFNHQLSRGGIPREWTTGSQRSDWEKLLHAENPQGNPKLKNKKTSAYGLGQFLDSTWKWLGVEKTDCPSCQIGAMAIYFRRFGHKTPSGALRHFKLKRWY